MPPRVKIIPPKVLVAIALGLSLAAVTMFSASGKNATAAEPAAVKTAGKEAGKAIDKGTEKSAAEKNESTNAGKAQVLQDLDGQVELRRSVIAREEERLNATKAALEAVKGELKKEYEKLEALKRDVEAQIARRDKVVNERLDAIAKVYQSMKPKEAATALEGMENVMAVAIIERLPGKTAAKLFDVMPKERVRELTRLLEEGRKQ